MLCYKCAKKGKESQAVGICVVCGMGLCQDHVRIAEVTFTEMVLMDTAGMAMLGMERKRERKAPRFLCDDCYAGVAQTLTDRNSIKGGEKYVL
ncbi:MAG: DUF2180 family protein [Methanobacteriota archaeon]